MIRLLPYIIAPCLCVILYWGVTNQNWTPSYTYACPYDLSLDELQEAVDRYVLAVNAVPYDLMPHSTEGDVSAYAEPVTMYMDGKPRWTIAQADNISNQAILDRDLRHEYCHVYDVNVMGKTLEQTRNHEGWIR